MSRTPWSGIDARSARIHAAVEQVRSWPLFALRPVLRAYVVAMCTAAVALAVAVLATTPLHAADLRTWALLLVAGALSVEAARRIGEPAGTSRDMLSAVTLPIALLLPPAYALLAPLPLTVATQLRLGRSPVHRRAFSIAVIGLTAFARSSVFHAIIGPLGPAAHAGGTRATLAIATAIGVGLVFTEVNVALVAVAVRLNAPEVRWRELLADGESWLLDTGEVGAGVLVAAAWTVSPLGLLAALPPMLLLQRALTHAQLRAASRVDAKTGLLNASAWQGEAEREIVRAVRARTPLALVIADLDHFKRVNDTCGHLVGDRLLAAIATALRGELRPYDVVGRFGGEEFALVLPNTDAAEAQQVTERLRHAVAAATVSGPAGTAVGVTVSMGVVLLTDPRSDLTDMLAAADAALYGAKAAGRDRVTFAAA